MNTNMEDRNYDRDQNQQKNEQDQTENPSYSSRDDQDDVSTTDDPQNYSRDSSTRDLEMRWQEIEKNYRRRYPELTDDDLSYREGEFIDMTERIAERTNRSHQEVHDEIWEFDSDLFESAEEYEQE